MCVPYSKSNVLPFFCRSFLVPLYSHICRNARNARTHPTIQRGAGSFSHNEIKKKGIGLLNDV